MKKIMKTFFLIFIYMLFFVELLCINATSNTCTFSHNVKEIKEISLPMAMGDYLYSVEKQFVDEQDLYRLFNISGWLIKQSNDEYLPVKADLLLRSDSICYKLNLYTEKRTDLYYLDQSDPDNENLYVGWFSKVPAANIYNGKYNIGFIVEENKEKRVLWTDNYISIVWDDIKKTNNIIDFIENIKNKNDYIMLIAVKDEGSRALTEQIFSQFRELGLAFDLAGRHRWAYLAVIDDEKVIYENLSKQDISFVDNIDNNELFLYSAGFDFGNDCSIKINGEEYSLKQRGINIVVYDKQSGYVVDSICVDTFADNSLIR